MNLLLDVENCSSHGAVYQDGCNWFNIPYDLVYASGIRYDSHYLDGICVDAHNSFFSTSVL